MCGAGDVGAGLREPKNATDDLATGQMGMGSVWWIPPGPHRVLSQRLYLGHWGAKRNFWGFGLARTGVPFSDRCTNDPKPFGP